VNEHRPGWAESASLTVQPSQTGTRARARRTHEEPSDPSHDHGGGRLVGIRHSASAVPQRPAAPRDTVPVPPSPRHRRGGRRPGRSPCGWPVTPPWPIPVAVAPSAGAASSTPCSTATSSSRTGPSAVAASRPGLGGRHPLLRRYGRQEPGLRPPDVRGRNSRRSARRRPRARSTTACASARTTVSPDQARWARSSATTTPTSKPTARSVSPALSPTTYAARTSRSPHTSGSHALTAAAPTEPDRTPDVPAPADQLPADRATLARPASWKDPMCLLHPPVQVPGGSPVEPCSQFAPHPPVPWSGEPESARSLSC
jgi:hypothetical protein